MTDREISYEEEDDFGYIGARVRRKREGKPARFSYGPKIEDQVKPYRCWWCRTWITSGSHFYPLRRDQKTFGWACTVRCEREAMRLAGRY